MVYNDPYKQFRPQGKLVKEDGGIRFMDSIILGTIYDELRAMRQIIDTDDNDDCSTDNAMTPDDNSELILGADSPAVATEDLWPDPAHVFRLWQIYLERVNPLTKIIHVPSLQPYLAEAITGCQNLPKNIEALLFSIFVMGAVAMSAEECQTLLGYSREAALQRFSTGVRVTLIRLGFLKTHDLTVLQAVVIYLLSLQGRYNRHAAWILNGIVIRMAQKMGLHHDGEMLGLGPFESEMRRRLWWQIIMADAKYAMLTGLSHSLLPRSWNTKEPRNLNDADLFPSATEPFQDREGPTEMIFCLITNRIGKFLIESPGFEMMVMLVEFGDLGAPDSPQMQEFRRTVESLASELLSLLDRFCDPSAGPVHEMAVEMRSQIIQKLGQLMDPSRGQPELRAELKSPKDNAFMIALSSLEHNERSYHLARDKGFLWFWLAHFQLDVFIYMVGQLCQRTEGKIVDRAWRQVAVVYEFHPELYDVTTNKTYHTLARFILKAWARREELLRAQTGRSPEVPEYVERLRSAMDSEDLRSDAPAPPETLTQQLIVSGPANPLDPSFDQFLTGIFDSPPVDWEMFGGPMLPNGQNAAPFRYNVGPF
ncbi:hypothetical protein VTK73DRAFT_9544 [Phialemonium thermophilum]|uniref:Xylanolytic transcriptional activator regulatory domain-containing protein n=1 Tax=Phialemonium thermophilum TaxID=223376 RepID=A0ABR3W200_9PEZI